MHLANKRRAASGMLQKDTKKLLSKNTKIVLMVIGAVIALAILILCTIWISNAIYNSHL